MALLSLMIGGKRHPTVMLLSCKDAYGIFPGLVNGDSEILPLEVTKAPTFPEYCVNGHFFLSNNKGIQLRKQCRFRSKILQKLFEGFRSDTTLNVA